VAAVSSVRFWVESTADRPLCGSLRNFRLWPVSDRQTNGSRRPLSGQTELDQASRWLHDGRRIAGNVTVDPASVRITAYVKS